VKILISELSADSYITIVLVNVTVALALFLHRFFVNRGN